MIANPQTYLFSKCFLALFTRDSCIFGEDLLVESLLTIIGTSTILQTSDHKSIMFCEGDKKNFSTIKRSLMKIFNVTSNAICSIIFILQKKKKIQNIHGMLCLSFKALSYHFCTRNLNNRSIKFYIALFKTGDPHKTPDFIELNYQYIFQRLRVFNNFTSNETK